MSRRLSMSGFSVSDLKAAVDWFNSLSAKEKLHYRKYIDTNHPIAITQYWIKNIKGESK